MTRPGAVRLVAASVLVGAIAAVAVHVAGQGAPVGSGAAHPLRGDANLITAADIAAPRMGTAAPSWTQWTLTTDPTLACQGRWLTDLGGTLLLRKLQTAAGHDPGDPVVREAVLQFDSEAAARTAYATASGWLSNCPATEFPADHALRSMLTTPNPPRTWTAQGFVGVWQQSRLPAGAAATPTYDQFVGRSGNRLLIFEYSQAVAAGDSDANQPFAATLEKAAHRAAL